jgi:(p)ppGpp synthase/HD superfamily hydrolase
VTGSVWSQEGYIRAYRFAAEKHRWQRVPGTHLPYIMHLSLVSMELAAALAQEGGRNGDLAMQCAMLHDTLEDTGTRYGELKEAFGESVASGVLALSKNGKLAGGLQLADSLQRIRLQPSEVWMVKLADRITNLQPPPKSWKQDKITRYHRQAKEILAALGPASPCLTVRLAQKIEDYRVFVR